MQQTASVTKSVLFDDFFRPSQGVGFFEIRDVSEADEIKTKNHRIGWFLNW
jgi:hypothetical protein